MQRFRPNPAILASMLLYFSLGAALQLSSPQQLSRPLSPQDAVDTVEIQQTLNYYGLVVDLRRFDLLQYVFTPDVTVNFNTPGLPILHGLNAVTTFMSKALQSVNSFHAQSTHYIDLSNKTKPTATTYNSAKFFGTGDRKGKVYSDWGRSVELFRQ